ncbi:hypothetical protein AVEN_248306-1 [Araneus ventricosus]|uniref:Uncharacterized protein n=1 Tax=Araneus ventricosus TaxID=182803 RepID=A0A4Y2KK32_ARAVE|nr:hypothetical protein AVEN_248306-1 [Araneus ventricosus]
MYKKYLHRESVVIAKVFNLEILIILHVLNQSFTISPLHANGVVVIHNIPFFGPSILEGKAQPMNLQNPPSKLKPLSASVSSEGRDSPHVSASLAFQRLCPDTPNGAYGYSDW